MKGKFGVTLVTASNCVRVSAMWCYELGGCYDKN